MAKKRAKLTSDQETNIADAFALNRKAIEKALDEAKRKIMRSHAALEEWLLKSGGETPKGSGSDGRP